MSSNRIISFLVLLLFLVTLSTLTFSIWYYISIRKMLRLQYQTAVINRQETLFKGLMTDSVEYGKKNPRIEPLLQSMGVVRQPQPLPDQTRPR